MSLQLDALSAAVDSILAKESVAAQAVATASADRDKAVAALAEEQQQRATEQASMQAQIDALVAKLNAAP